MSMTPHCRGERGVTCNTVQKMSLQIFQDNINAKLAAFRDEGWPFIEVEVMREGCGKASS